jgi:hypothetical protein
LVLLALSFSTSKPLINLKYYHIFK